MFVRLLIGNHILSFHERTNIVHSQHSNFSVCAYLCRVQCALCLLFIVVSTLYTVHGVKLKLNDFVKQKSAKQLSYAYFMHTWLLKKSNCKTVMLMIDCQLTSLTWYLLMNEKRHKTFLIKSFFYCFISHWIPANVMGSYAKSSNLH